jgi:hypothetical protein
MVMSSAVAQAVDRKRHKSQQSLEAFLERRDRQYRNGFGFRRPLLLRHPAPIARRCEGDDAEGVIELPGHQIGNRSLKVRSLDIGLAVGGAKPPKAVDYQIDRVIRAAGRRRHNGRRPACSKQRNSKNANAIKPIFKHEIRNRSVLLMG